MESLMFSAECLVLRVWGSEFWVEGLGLRVDG